MLKVGYIGLGLMGKSIARNILKAGFPVVVHNRSQASVDELVAEGATRANSPKEAASLVHPDDEADAQDDEAEDQGQRLHDIAHHAHAEEHHAQAHDHGAVMANPVALGGEQHAEADRDHRQRRLGGGAILDPLICLYNYSLSCMNI